MYFNDNKILDSVFVDVVVLQNIERKIHFEMRTNWVDISQTV